MTPNNKMTPFERIQRIRIGGAVERCHTVKHIGTYSNAQHSWGVAMLMYELWPEDFPRLAIYCLAHDVPEGWVGDTPATIKAWEPGLKESYDGMEQKVLAWLSLPNDNLQLSSGDQKKLKACDHLELYFWAREQQLMGNRFSQCVIKALDAFFMERPLPSPALELYADLRSSDRLDAWPVLSDIRRIP